MTLNQVTQAIKNTYGTAYLNGKLYYVLREANGSYSLMRDSNLFDGKAGEALVTDLPVGKNYDIIFVGDERIILTTDNASVLGLWLMDLKTATTDQKPTWVKVASGVGTGTWYEHHNLKPKLFFTVGRKLMGYDFIAKTEKVLRDFPQNLQLLGKRDESLFLNVGGQLKVSDTAGANLFDIGNINNATVYFGLDAKKVWTLRAGSLIEWTLRNSDTNIFGGVRRWWI